jgi:hypothetical protein
VAVRRPDDGPSGEATAGYSDARLRGASAVKLHATLIAGLTICVVGFVIEVGRALGGNSLSWAYVFEWPIFAVFAIYMWWNLLHDPQGRGKPSRPSTDPVSADAVEGGPTGATAGTGQADVDPDLAAWQAYLRKMEAAEADDPDGPGRR